MARTLLPGHLPLDDDTLDRFSVGPDKKLYIDNEKLVTQDLFEAFKKAGWLVKTATVTGILLAMANLANTVLEWNDRYCWEPWLYSSANKCSHKDKGATLPAGSRAGGNSDSVNAAPR